MRIAVIAAALSFLVCACSDRTPVLSGRVLFDEGDLGPEDIIVYASVGEFPPPSEDDVAKAATLDSNDTSVYGTRVRVMARTPAGATWQDKKPVYPNATFQQFQVRADADGNYAFASLPEGTCYVTAWFIVTRFGGGASILPLHHRVEFARDKPVRKDIHISRFDIVDM